MSKKLPLFFVDREALLRMNMCSHISKNNEFESGVMCIPVENIEELIEARIQRTQRMGLITNVFLIFIGSVIGRLIALRLGW